MDIIRTLEGFSYKIHIIILTRTDLNKFLVQVKKLWCCVGARVKHENLVLSNELIKDRWNNHRGRF